MLLTRCIVTSGGPNPEPRATRLNTIQAVFQAIQDRAVENPSFSTVSSLTLYHLQNSPTDDFTDSELFLDVMVNIKHLTVLFVEEDDEHGPDNDIYLFERCEWEQYFQKFWIAPFADQFVSLSIAAVQEWGTAPGYFNCNGLDFPNLKTLYLRHFVISHDDHLDWVLAQKSLTSLRFDTCWIARDLEIGSEEIKHWKLHTHDWKQVSPTLEGCEVWRRDHRFYLYDATWADFFDKIRTQLPHLVDFRFHSGPNRWRDQDECMINQNLMKTRLAINRYATNGGTWDTGSDAKGDFDSFDETGLKTINFAQEAEERDRKAFEMLLKTTRARVLGHELPLS